MAAPPLFNKLSFQLTQLNDKMEKSLVPVVCNELYVTHAEYQGCFIKIWANSYSKKKGNLERDLQDYTSYSKEFTKLDLYGNTMYLYIWKKDSLIRVYRCQVIASDLSTKTHTIVLIDYGQKLVVPFVDVRELAKNVDHSLAIGLSQRVTVITFLLSGYLSKQAKSNQGLIQILCNKYYKYRRDFEVGGMTFVTLFDVNKKILDIGVINAIDVGSMMSIAKSMPSIISSNNTLDIIQSCPIPSKAQQLCSFLKSQNLVYADYTDVMVTEFAVDDNIILLTIRTIDSDDELLNRMLSTLDRQNLKLAPVIEAYTSCLIIFNNKLVRVIILEVKINKLYVDLVDYGIKKYIPRTSSVFEIPPNLKLIEIRSLNVILDKPINVTVDKTLFIQKYFKMLPLKIDSTFGLYKVKLFKKTDGNFINVCDTLSIINDDHDSLTSKSPEPFSITEINEDSKSIDKSIEIVLIDLNDNIETSINYEDSTTMDKSIKTSFKDLKEDKDISIKTSINNLKNFPILTLNREILEGNLELVGSLIEYKSPFNFRIKKYNPNFLLFMDQILSDLDSRYILTKSDVVKNMYAIFKNQSDVIYRTQIVDIDSDIEKISLQLVDEGNKIIHDNFNNIVLYNFIESDCCLPGQLVLDCSLNDMWFPVLDIDISTLLKPYFIKGKLYNIQIVETDEYNVNLVHMVENDTNIDISNSILNSGIGQRLCAAMKTDENPYEESLLKGQSFLSYVYHYHFKLYIQPEPNVVNELEAEILEYLKESTVHNSEPLNVNSLLDSYCLVTGNNGQWYRSKVKNINENTVIVEMFDIGLLTEVSLEQIRPISDKLMKIPQLGLHCSLEANHLDVKITEKTLYKITVKSINDNGTLNVSIKEHRAAPLSSPIIRGIEKICFVHVEGDLTYMHRYQDKFKIEKMSEILSKLSVKIVCSNSLVLGKVYMFESHGKYYRCVVKSTNSKTIVVHCIDYGFEKQINKKKLQYLEDTKIALLPALVIVVKTFPMAFNMSNTTFLANLHLDNDGTLNALPNKTSSLLNSQNELIKSLENGCLVKITHVYSDDGCWIVPHLFFDKLKTISRELVKMQAKIIPVETEIGSLCAALHSITKHWHRALILDKDEEDNNILSIDSGERFKALKTTRLVGEIQKIPNCAMRCKIVSNVDVKSLLNKEVKCKLISYTQPLLEVELLTDHMDIVEIIPTQPVVECVVTISSFESFEEFWIKKCNDNPLNSIADELDDFTQQLSIGTLVAAITDIGDGIWYECEVLSPIYSHLDSSPCAIVRIVNNGNICQTKKIKVLPYYLSSRKSYRCHLGKNVEDYSDIMTSVNLVSIRKTMMKLHWTMKTTSKNEPYVVTLTYNNLDCIDLLRKNINDFEISNNIKSSEINSNVHGMDNIEHTEESISKNLSNGILMENSSKKDIIFPDVEIVTIKQVDTIQYFYAHSKSLSDLYEEKINYNLEICIIELPLKHSMVGTIVVTSSKSLNCWCRAKIDKIYSDGRVAHCYLVDYGFYENCYEFYKPTDFLCSCPPIVRRCSLYAPSLISKSNEVWFSNIDEMFKDILTIDNIQFDMIIKKDGDPCLVTLLLDDSDVYKMLHPIHVQVTYINSFVDFKIKALSPHQKAVTEFMDDNNIKFKNKKPSMEMVKTPITDRIYLARINSNFKRVKFDSIDGIKYVVVDIDDTLDHLSVDNLYELPQNLRQLPVFTMSCSLILNNPDEYSLTKFCTLAYSKVTFLMCIITESSGGRYPNHVKLYLDNKDVLDILKI
ncbi:Hypothetical protein CINCED_3A019121 [Cinara cedri]|uniref:Tudor domain-containing protein n=1 Tax=Cinara cedri TaxID=506608 RepID=A0A5E4M596_9HEMI|nr:Hypothetical protein CINCED_3A019121 [Cinara cedri]